MNIMKEKKHIGDACQSQFNCEHIICNTLAVLSQFWAKLTTPTSANTKHVQKFNIYLAMAFLILSFQSTSIFKNKKRTTYIYKRK